MNKSIKVKDNRQRGEEHYRARLSEDDIHRIRALRREGYSFGAIGTQYNIAPQHARDIYERKIWKHL